MKKQIIFFVWALVAIVFVGGNIPTAWAVEESSWVKVPDGELPQRGVCSKAGSYVVASKKNLWLWVGDKSKAEKRAFPTGSKFLAESDGKGGHSVTTACGHGRIFEVDPSSLKMIAGSGIPLPTKVADPPDKGKEVPKKVHRRTRSNPETVVPLQASALPGPPGPPGPKGDGLSEEYLAWLVEQRLIATSTPPCLTLAPCTPKILVSGEGVAEEVDVNCSNSLPSFSMRVCRALKTLSNEEERRALLFKGIFLKVGKCAADFAVGYGGHKVRDHIANRGEKSLLWLGFSLDILRLKEKYVETGTILPTWQEAAWWGGCTLFGGVIAHNGDYHRGDGSPPATPPIAVDPGPTHVDGGSGPGIVLVVTTGEATKPW
jgi:hypothetical protein